MNRTSMKTSYLASAAFTLVLLGCSADIGQDTPQQAGRAGTAGNKGLAGAVNAAGAGAGGASATGGTTAVGGSTAIGGSTAVAGTTAVGGSTAAAGAATGGTGGVDPWAAFAGFPFAGRDSIGFGFGGARSQSDFESSFAGLWGFSGADGNLWNLGGAGGSRIWASP
jgi:hypothetical protein